MDGNVDGESPVKDRMKWVLMILLAIETLAVFGHVNV